VWLTGNILPSPTYSHGTPVDFMDARNNIYICIIYEKMTKKRRNARTIARTRVSGVTYLLCIYFVSKMTKKSVYDCSYTRFG
jgi:hypothetical protein